MDEFLTYYNISRKREKKIVNKFIIDDAKNSIIQESAPLLALFIVLNWDSTYNINK